MRMVCVWKCKTSCTVPLSGAPAIQQTSVEVRECIDCLLHRPLMRAASAAAPHVVTEETYKKLYEEWWTAHLQETEG